ncbi:MAG: hypothetical protein IIA33_04950 [Planctomycetes bacterium]|nr:hypothetical protein [Planctomycetota bacterium]
MFDENAYLLRDGLKVGLSLSVRCGTPMTKMLEIWMAEVSRDMLRLGVYFRALGIMLQIPGAPDYEWFSDADGEDQFETDDLFNGSDENTLFTVLGEALERLGVGHLMEQLPEADYQAVELDDEWQAMLDRREKNKNGLLSLVADCLDRLIVDPGMAEIVQVPVQPWWNQCVPQR